MKPCIIENCDQKYMVKEMKRVLRTGGIVYVNDFLLNEDERNMARYETCREKYGVYGRT